MKSQRVYQCMNNTFGKDARYVSTIGLSQLAFDNINAPGLEGYGLACWTDKMKQVSPP